MPISAANSIGKKKRRVIELPNGMRVIADSDSKLRFIVEPEKLDTKDPKPVEAKPGREAAPVITPDAQHTAKSSLGFDDANIGIAPSERQEPLQARVDTLNAPRATETERLLRRIAVENELSRLARVAEAERRAAAEKRRMDDEEAAVAILLALESSEMIHPYSTEGAQTK